MQPTSASNSSDPQPLQHSKPPPPPQQQQHQQWMAMQYPPPMVMQPQMMPQHFPHPPPYMPPAAAYLPHPYMQPPPQPLHHGHHHHRNNSNNNGDSAAENKTVWVGDLHHWMDEQYLNSCFAPNHQITNIKLIRNKQTGFSEGYGFIEFNSHATAEKAIQSYAGSTMPNTDQLFRLNWAAFSSGGDKRAADSGSSDHSIFVGDLAADVTDGLLLETFASKYLSAKAAKVVIDVNTGRSKGYGFVRFGDDSERTQAMTEMNGVYCSTRPMRTGAATPRKSTGSQQGGYSANGSSVQGSQSDGDSTNTTIFVGGLDKEATDDDLWQPFSQYGEIVSVKIPANKNCGFVQFVNRSDAEEALDKLSGTTIGKQTVRLSWGRNHPSNKQMRNDYGSPWNGGYYGGGPVYDYYAVPHPHDASIYSAAVAYGGYPVYGNQQQVS